MSLLRETATVAAKDIRVEVRGRHATSVVLPFGATLLVSFGLAFGPGPTLLRQTAPGLLWLAVLFSTVLATRRSYEVEGEDGALEGLVLSPLDKAAVFLGKAAAIAVQVLVLAAAAVLLVVLLFDLPVAGDPFTLVAAFALGAVGLAATASLFGVVAESPRAREGLFPLLLFPLVTPVLLAGTRATATAGTAEAASWLGLLAAFDVIFLAAGTLVFGHLLED